MPPLLHILGGMSRLINRRLFRSVALIGVLVCLFAQPSAEAQESPSGPPSSPPSDEVTVVMTELAPFVLNDADDADGFYAEIWDEVAARLGVRYDVVWVDSFAELLPAVADGRADIAIAPLAPTAEREAIYDFTSAVVASGPQIGFSDRLDSRPSLLRSMFDTRVLRLFALVLAGLLVLAHLIWLFERNRHDEDGDFDRSYVQGVWDGLWWSTVTATTVGYGDKAPKSFGGRLIALLAMLSSLVLIAAFVSQVTSIMAEELDRPAISNLDDVHSPIGVVAGSSFADYLASRGVAIIEFDTQLELFDALSEREIDVVVSNPYALAQLQKTVGIHRVEGVLYSEFETFGLAQDSLWREPINQVIAELHASGEIAEIVKDGLN